MEGLQARFDSFKKSKKVKVGQKTKILKWPHPKSFKATPDTLAEAGFYYNPSLDDPDNATCYVCSKELGSWEENDDPMTIHWEKCGQTCCWASIRCGSVYDLDSSGRFVSTDKSRIPTSKAMEKARYETFQLGKGWVHDKEKSHGANSKAMARAGFTYTPEASGDDLATCFYCNLSLSGWEPEDDPLEQHRQRSEKEQGCPFFSHSTETKKPSKPASKTQTKPNSRSTSRTAHQDVVMPTKDHDGDPEAESDSAQPTARKSTAKTPRKARSTSGASTRKSSAKAPKTKRSTSRSTLKDVAEIDEDEQEDENMSEPPPPATKKKSKSKSVARSEATEEEDISEAPSTVKKKSRSKSVAQPDITDQTGEEDEEPETRKPSRSKAKSKAVVDSQDEATVKPSRSRSKASMAASTEEPARKSSRKTKAKVQESEQEDDTPVAPSKKKPSQKRAASKSKAKPITIVSEEDEDSEEEVEEEVVPPPVPKKKPAKSIPVKPAVQDVFDDDDPMDTDEPPPKPLSKSQRSTTELAPLSIPKRTKATPIIEDETSAPSSSREQPKPAKPKSKTKQRTPAPQDSRSEREQSTSDELMPLSPVMNHQNIAPIAKEKPVGKPISFTSSSFNNPSKHAKPKVLEISSDEDVEDTPVKRRTPGPVLQFGKENLRGVRATTEEPMPAPPPEPKIPPPVPPKDVIPLEKSPSVEMSVDPSTPPRSPEPDVDMQDVQQEHIIDRPSTPPQPTVKSPSSPKGKKLSLPTTTDEAKPVDPPIFPALSKLPFAPLTTLSEAELDMTVEEWIRYQMEVEFDKFRRDGERELQRFRKKAEDVRKVIEGL